MDEGKLTRILQNRKEIKTAIKVNKDLATKPRLAGGYPNREREWRGYDLSIDNFGSTFFNTLPYEPGKYTEDQIHEAEDGDIFKEYIQSTLRKSKNKNLTAVEFGGSGSNLFNGFSRHFFDSTVGVCLEDIRDTYQEKDDSQINHSVIEGDIMDPENSSLIERVLTTLETKKVDLIICRMMMPLRFIRKNNAVLDRIVRNWYRILNENGLMFIQFEWESPLAKGEPLPKEKQGDVEEWANKVREKFPEIDIQIGDGVLRLHKRAGSPDTLPPATQLF